MSKAISGRYFDKKKEKNSFFYIIIITAEHNIVYRVTLLIYIYIASLCLKPNINQRNMQNTCFRNYYNI